MRFTTLFLTLFGLATILSLAQAAPVPAVDAVAVQGTGEHGSDALLSSRRRRRDHTTASRITWYSGGMLNNPACGGATPSKNAMIAAVQQGGAYSCGNTLSIKYHGKHVKVRVVDYCEGCDSTAIDLSTGAFKHLASLNKGELNGASVTIS